MEEKENKGRGKYYGITKEIYSVRNSNRKHSKNTMQQDEERVRHCRHQGREGKEKKRKLTEFRGKKELKNHLI